MPSDCRAAHFSFLPEKPKHIRTFANILRHTFRKHFVVVELKQIFNAENGARTPEHCIAMYVCNRLLQIFFSSLKKFLQIFRLQIFEDNHTRCIKKIIKWNIFFHFFFLLWQNEIVFSFRIFKFWIVIAHWNRTKWL